MQEKVDKLVLKAKKIADVVKEHNGPIRVFSHYDADGITSAAIMTKALLREGKKIHLSFAKQLSEEVLKDFNGKYGLAVLLDMGAGQLELIKAHLLDKGVKVIVSDHHQAQGDVVSQNLHHLNPVLVDITDNISGSGTTYILASALSPANKDLADLAIVGAIGDSQIGSIGPNWGLFGLNKEILKDAQDAGKISVSKGLRLWGKSSRALHKALEYSVEPYIPGVTGSESAAVQFLTDIGIELKTGDVWRTLSELSEEEQQKLATGIITERIRGGQENPEWIFGDVYELTCKKEFRDANEFATILNATGKMKKAFLGLELCLSPTESVEEIRQILDEYRKEIGRALRLFEGRPELIRSAENSTFIFAGDAISEHILSNVTSIIARSGLVRNQNPIFAFVDAEDGKVKISARDQNLSKNALDPLNLAEIVSAAAKRSGGEGGGHSGAAGATIPKGAEENFVKAVEEALKKHINHPEQERDIHSSFRELTHPSSTGERAAQRAEEQKTIKKGIELYKEDVNNGKRESAGAETGEGKTGSSQARSESREDKAVEGKGLVQYFGTKRV